ncbi:hypothetical protein [Halorhabdus amylolytica]|uniref:hypothetical protein n=1 Tax=Halorhabdus amylolytica TaxID=2559573 RepID=UPI00145A2394|nr:hypothetical protein [Halorhabdus amylolytica]
MGIPAIDDPHFKSEPSVDAPPGSRSRALRERQREIESEAALYPTDLPLGIPATPPASTVMHNTTARPKATSIDRLDARRSE